MSAPCTELQEWDERKRALTSKYFFTFFFFFLFTYTTDFTEKRGPLVSYLQCYPHFIPFLNAGRNSCFKNILKNLSRFKISSNNFPFLSPLCNLLAFTRSVCDFANKPITSKNSDLDMGKLTCTFLRTFVVLFSQNLVSCFVSFCSRKFVILCLEFSQVS